MVDDGYDTTGAARNGGMRSDESDTKDFSIEMKSFTDDRKDNIK
jgi:hypothetical protein